MVKDIIVIYRKNKTILVLISLETLYFASWKLNTLLKYSLTLRIHFNSRHRLSYFFVKILNTLSGAYDFQQCDILRSVDSDKPVQSPIKL